MLKKKNQRKVENECASLRNVQELDVLGELQLSDETGNK